MTPAGVASAPDVHGGPDRDSAPDMDWPALYRRYDGLLHVIARSFRLNSSDADDAVQTTWLLLHQHAGRLREPERVSGWLGTTVRRTCLRIIRERGREQLTDDLSVCEPSSGDAGVEAAALQAERDQTLWAAVDRLPARQRQLVHVLFTTQEPTYDEVAAQLAMPRGAIGPTRGRALLGLRATLEADGWCADDLLDSVPSRV